jgi:hypothetical protein
VHDGVLVMEEEVGDEAVLALVVEVVEEEDKGVSR